MKNRYRNQEKAVVGAFSVIVKSSQTFVCSSNPEAVAVLTVCQQQVGVSVPLHLELELHQGVTHRGSGRGHQSWGGGGWGGGAGWS